MEKSLRRLRPLPCLLSYTAAVRSFGGSRSRNKGRGSQTANKCLMNTEGSYHFGKYQYSIFRHYILDVLRDTKYFDGWRTIDTLRYLVFWWLAYCWYFVILSIFMVGVLLILWDTKYFGGWRTVDTLRYLVFLWLAYCWYFEILSILMLAYCWYFDILSISVVGVLFILWDT